MNDLLPGLGEEFCRLLYNPCVLKLRDKARSGTSSPTHRHSRNCIVGVQTSQRLTKRDIVLISESTGFLGAPSDILLEQRGGSPAKCRPAQDNSLVFSIYLPGVVLTLVSLLTRQHFAHPFATGSTYLGKFGNTRPN